MFNQRGNTTGAKSQKRREMPLILTRLDFKNRSWKPIVCVAFDSDTQLLFIWQAFQPHKGVWTSTVEAQWICNLNVLRTNQNHGFGVGVSAFIRSRNIRITTATTTITICDMSNMCAYLLFSPGCTVIPGIVCRTSRVRKLIDRVEHTIQLCSNSLQVCFHHF